MRIVVYSAGGQAEGREDTRGFDGVCNADGEALNGAVGDVRRNGNARRWLKIGTGFATAECRSFESSRWPIWQIAQKFIAHVDHAQIQSHVVSTMPCPHKSTGQRTTLALTFLIASLPKQKCPTTLPPPPSTTTTTPKCPTSNNKINRPHPPALQSRCAPSTPSSPRTPTPTRPPTSQPRATR